MAKAKKLALLVTLGALLTCVVTAQSNELIDVILEEEFASVGSAAYVILAAAGSIDDMTSPQEAYGLATRNGWLSEEKGAGDPITFGEFSHLLMQSFGKGGGLMYLIFPGPRYAAREIVYQGWSAENKGPADFISGEFMLRVTGNFLEMEGVSR